MTSRSSTDGSDHKEEPSKDLVVSNVNDVPDAAAVATAAVSGMTISKEEGSRLVRKIDSWILPLLCITYTIQVRHCVVPSQTAPADLRLTCSSWTRLLSRMPGTPGLLRDLAGAFRSPLHLLQHHGYSARQQPLALRV